MLQLQNSPHDFVINVNHCICTRFTIWKNAYAIVVFHNFFFSKMTKQIQTVMCSYSSLSSLLFHEHGFCYSYLSLLLLFLSLIIFSSTPYFLISNNLHTFLLLLIFSPISHYYYFPYFFHYIVIYSFSCISKPISIYPLSFSQIYSLLLNFLFCSN